MNHKYFLDLKNEAPKNGDMPFVMAVRQALVKADVFLGMILYRKTDQLFPEPTYEVLNEVNCATIPFNEKANPELLKDSISRACKHLARLAGFKAHPVAMMYHQDERLLAAQPNDIPFAITHHGPILADVARFYPRAQDLLKAFGTDSGSWQKVTELAELQASGLQSITKRSDGYILAMSDIQGKHFRSSGVDIQKVLNFPPPLQAMLSAHAPQLGTKRLFGVNDKKFLFTAVARLTFFKNIELLIDGAVLLLERGLSDLSILVAGGDESKVHEDIRSQLLSRIPSRFRKNFHVIQRMPQEELYAYFGSRQVQETGIFVCCSRYETLGITPLEAALSGVSTIITDRAPVEAARYFPPGYRFEAETRALADRLEQLFRGDMRKGGQDLRSHVMKATEERGDFEINFLRVWEKLSAFALLDK